MVQLSNVLDILLYMLLLSKLKVFLETKETLYFLNVDKLFLILFIC